MSRTVDVDERGKELIASFPFDRALKDWVKSLPGARFDWSSKTWRFAVDQAPAVLPSLVARGFVLAAAAAELAPPPAIASGDVVASDGAPPALSVRELNALVQRAVAVGVPPSLWVVATLQAWDRGAHRRHVYFTLEELGGDGQSADRAASIDAVMFGTVRDRVERVLAREGVALADGLAVRVRGHVEVFVDRGRVQLVVDDIDPRYSLGELALKRDAVVAALRAEGLADRQPARELPLLPLRVALITSVGSDAYHDVVQTLSDSGYAFAVEPLDVRVQGPDLERTVCAALAAIARRASDVDVVVIARGGGGRVELAAWDNLAVARAVASLPIKVLVAIGHQQDQSALDLIATSYKTPTAAAERLVEQVAVAEARLERLADSLSIAATAAVTAAADTLADRGLRLARAARATMVAVRASVERELPARIAASARARQLAGRRELAAAAARMSARAVARNTEARRSQVDVLAAKVAAVDPVRALRRGFAIVRRPDGSVITNAAELSTGAPVVLDLRDGSVRATISDAPTLAPPAAPGAAAPAAADDPAPAAADPVDNTDHAEPQR